MTKLSVTYFDVAGPALIRPARHGDERGYFCETWNAEDWQDAGLPNVNWVQDNEAFSATAGTTRGLHFQAPPRAQAKLVRAVRGAILDVIVDIRQDSETYGKSVSAMLDAETGAQIFVPRGFAHGYQTLEENTLIAYKCDAPYAPSAEGGLLWSDTDLGIDWPKAEDVVMSGKDFTWPPLAKLDSPFKGRDD